MSYARISEPNTKLEKTHKNVTTRHTTRSEVVLRPAMSERFRAKKQNILRKLSLPDHEYTDCSPKGSVDESIRTLVDEINATSDFVTTSSCSGRISVYLEGSPNFNLSNFSDGTRETTNVSSTDSNPATWASGKGGGRWLFTSHYPVEFPEDPTPGEIFTRLGFPSDTSVSSTQGVHRVQFVHFKFEPMILHILTSTAERAQLALNAAISAGFRESGISSLFDSKARLTNPMLAVRSSGLGIDSIIGFRSEDSQLFPTVSETYLHTLISVANERFRVNAQRMERFRRGFVKLAGDSSETCSASFEPVALRKERLRREGLLRSDALRSGVGGGDNSVNGQSKSDEDWSNGLYFGLDLFASQPSQ